MSEYVRNVVAQGVMEHQTAELSEPSRRRVTDMKPMNFWFYILRFAELFN
jgi:hypothetical protein